MLTQESKKDIENKINLWYQQHSKEYFIHITSENAKAIKTKYQPEKNDEQNNLIRVDFCGMEIILAFSKPINQISIQKDSLQKFINYIAINKVYNDINPSQWEVYPMTPASSLRGTGIQFYENGETLNAKINWSIYAVIA